MLFDLRSRGRRRTVQVLYIGLAVLIGAGLVLFGVGTGSSGGGLFGALTGSNQTTSNNKAITGATKTAIAATKKNPSSAGAWANLVNARYSAANSLGFDSTTNTFTKTGVQQLSLLTGAYTRYLKLVKTPSANTAIIAARAYTQLGKFTTASTAYQAVASAESDSRQALICIAMNSYAAGNDGVAQLAQNKVVSKLPKTVRKQYVSEIESAKKSHAVVTSFCG